MLFDNLGVFNSTMVTKPNNMEPLGQGYGYILYERALLLRFYFNFCVRVDEIVLQIMSEQRMH